MTRTATAKKEWKLWTWQTPKGKIFTKGAWHTKAEAAYAADDIYGSDDYKVVPVLVSVK